MSCISVFRDISSYSLFDISSSSLRAPAKNENYIFSKIIQEMKRVYFLNIQ